MLELGTAFHATTRRLVAAGRVACPIIGEVSVERCLECPRLVRLEEHRRVSVVCDLDTDDDWLA